MAIHSEHGYIYSKDNVKMNAVERVLSFSVMPGTTCADGVPCIKKCYAMRMTKYHPNVGKAWRNNTELLKGENGYDNFVNDTCKILEKTGLKLMRFNIGGDLFSKEYIDSIIEISERNPDVKFWTYSKQFDTVRNIDRDLPENLHIVLSEWMDCHVPDDLKEKYGVCYFGDKGGNAAIPEDAFVCDGGCSKCLVCTNLKAGQSVVIHEH